MFGHTSWNYAVSECQLMTLPDPWINELWLAYWPNI